MSQLSKIQFIRSGDGTINLFFGGSPFTITIDFPTYNELDSALKAGTATESDMPALLNIKEVVKKMAQRVSQGKVDIDLDAGIVTYDGIQFPDKSLCDRILRLMSEGQPFEFMVNFLERLAKNPSLRSVMALFNFISVHGFPITPDGMVLGYRGVREDWKDCYSGTVDNSVGAKPEMPRESCDSNRHADCSKGYHIGTHEYAKGWSQGHVVLVKFDPQDVVSIPDSNTTFKLRVCKYEVIADHTNMGILTGEVYDSTGKAVLASTVAGQFDNDSADHWDVVGAGESFDRDDEGYDDWYDDEDELEDEDEDEDWYDDGYLSN